jgi:hypothetical protein
VQPLQEKYVTGSEHGRWPANLALSHLPECERIGAKRVKASGYYPEQRGEGVATGFGKGRPDPNGGRQSGDGDGTETIPSYECAPGCPVAELDRQSGERPGMSGGGNHREDYEGGMFGAIDCSHTARGDTGGASRFFYTAKASRGERNAGLDGFEERKTATLSGGDMTDQKGRAVNGRAGKSVRQNAHPTVKPIDLMRWLVRLVTPPGGIVLDPFMGSGTTGIAAHLEGFDFIGIEREAEYADIAKARIEWWSQFPAGTTTEAALGVEAVERKVKESGQGSLLEDAA